MEPRAAHSRVGGRRDQQELVINQAEQLLATITATNVVQRQPLELADELLDEIRGLDERLARSRRRISVSDAVTTSGTSLTEIFGVGPVVAARIMDYSGDPTPLPDRWPRPAYNGTAPVEFFSSGPTVHHLSRRGNRT
jgi:transposase